MTRRLTKTLWFVIGLLMMLALSNTAMTVWSVHQADRAIERLSLSNEVYQDYLKLESASYQLFKQYGDAATIGDRDEGSGEAELKAEIWTLISRIRGTIIAEIQLVGDEEIEELQMLTDIERRLERVIASLERQESKSYGQVVALLDKVIDVEYRAMIDAAIEEEVEEVAETRDEVEAALIFDRRLALGLAVFSILATALFAWVVYRRVATPALKVLEGTKRFAEGDLSHRIDLNSQDEFGSIASTLDTMAASLSERTAKMTARNESLDSELEQRNRQLEQLLTQARELEKQRKHLLTDVSHELRTPLTIIKGEAEIVLRGNDDRPADEYREALSRIRDAVGHSARIVDDLLTAARSEQGELRLMPKQFDLRELLESTSDTFVGGIGISGETGPATVRADPDKLRQALLVLMNNARHHGGRLVDVHLHRTPQGWRVDVEDDGRGLSDEDKKQAFQRFFRGSNAAENYSEGMGLGLPIARMIARAHGGDVTLHDREGGGTSARLDLPAQPMLRAAS